jgi:hypothetical protein
MDLQSFIAESLKAILAGVSEVKKDDARVAPEITGDDAPVSYRTFGSRVVFLAEFDVAVTVTRSVSGEAAAGGKLISVIEARGKGTASAEQSEVSRIKFAVPLDISAVAGQHYTGRTPSG